MDQRDALVLMTDRNPVTVTMKNVLLGSLQFHLRKTMSCSLMKC